MSIKIICCVGCFESIHLFSKLFIGLNRQLSFFCMHNGEKKPTKSPNRFIPNVKVWMPRSASRLCWRIFARFASQMVRLSMKWKILFPDYKKDLLWHTEYFLLQVICIVFDEHVWIMPIDCQVDDQAWVQNKHLRRGHKERWRLSLLMLYLKMMMILLIVDKM